MNKNQYYWFFVILFLPALGSILYLFLNVFQKQDIEKVQEEITTVINPTKIITDLEKKLMFSETFENRVALADAYLKAKMFDEAEGHYRTSLQGTFENDYYVNTQLLETLYFSSQFEKVLSHVGSIKDSPKFKKSRASFLYALALEKTGDIALAEEYLIKFDAPYSRYQERLELAKFYIRIDSIDKARALLKEIEEESVGMSKTSYKQNKILIKKAKDLLESGLGN
ncbi:hypothetical protein [Maribacter sp. HTCC2170]|uniref:hypothetical protein n=1 Tax=Maribacter sp. (strain HTCC2170 / KCCM 42371) TaxID=313603 RepID=UPI0011D298C2|nr:hypothetical protein [Maribacter sp. HTCC2170]